jgi:capsular exopolysaccharide synthesis family protein
MRNNNAGMNGGPLQDPPAGMLSMPPTEPYSLPGRNGSGSHGEAAQGFSLSFVLNALRQWWKLALPVGLLLAVGIGGVIWFTFEPTYRAESWLRIEERAPFIAFQDRGGSRGFVQTQVQLIRSPLVLGPAIAQELEEPDPETGAKTVGALPEVSEQDDPIEWLKREISVGAVGGSELFTVAFSARRPKHSADIVNAVVNSYFDLRAEEDAERTHRVIELLEQERERRAAEVERLRENVRELSKQATGKDPFRPLSESAITTTEHPIGDLRSQLTGTRVEGEVLKARIAALQEALPEHSENDEEGTGQVAGDAPEKDASPGVSGEDEGDTSKPAGAADQGLLASGADDDPTEVADAIVEQAVATHPRVVGLQAALDHDRAKLGEYKEKLKDAEEDPLYQKLAKRVESEQRELDAIRAELLPQLKSRLKAERIAQQEEELSQLKRQLKSNDVLESYLAEKFDDELSKLQEYSGETLELKFAQEDLTLEEEVFARIAGRITQLQTEQRAPARVRLMSEASPPKKPVELVPYKMILLGSLAGFGFPFGLALLWERFVRRVSDARDLGKCAQLPVIGEIARLPVRTGSFSRSSSRRVGHDLRVFEESVDSLRTCLALSEPLQDMKVFAVTSAANNEGKTSVAVQLAVSSARASGEIALLIDGDMRSPDVHKVLETRIGPGLAEVLNGDCRVEDAIITDWSKRVHILPAGKLQGSPHKLLGNGALRHLLEEVRSTYRHVVIDTPPILAAGEALVFAKASDASLICAMRDVSRMDQINTAHDRLVGAGANPVGVVLNGVPTKQYAYRYGTYEYYRARA